jgi:histidinol-phosphatase (PHP family)
MDYHIHTRFSPDATGEMSEYVEQASKKNIDEIGFSEHTILHYDTDYPCLSPHTMHNYVQEFLMVKRNSEIPIKLGVEVDFFAADVEKTADFLKEYPFDYVIGSVHYLGKWSVDSSRQVNEYSKRNILQVYEEYFAAVRRLCQSKLFDVLGHADLIKIFGFKPKTNYDNVLDDTAKALSRNDMCVEINTSGLIRPCREMYPSLPFLALLKKHNVPITFGSDAHRPSDVGRRFEEAIALVKEAGYTHACTFDSRRRTTERMNTT